MPLRYPSKAIVNLDAYASNLALVQQITGAHIQLIPIVKANAYGHGLEPIAQTAIKSGAKLIGVATVEEAVRLRDAGIETPILVMMPSSREALRLFVEYQLTPIVSDTSLAETLNTLANEARRVVPIHCKIDTGMGRQGIGYDEALEKLQFIKRITNLDIQGICTHFPTADRTDDSFTQAQIKSFKQLVKQMEKAGIPYEMAHAANSAAIVNYPDSLFDAARPGLMCYGVWPTKTNSTLPTLRRVLRWETSVVQVRQLKPHANIGYRRTYTTRAPIQTAILPVGYADGYRYPLSNNADVLIRGRRCPVRGAVSMDQIVVDVTAVPHVSYGDVATLIGVDGDLEITVEELAEKAGTISYDILTGIGPRVYREYVHDKPEAT